MQGHPASGGIARLVDELVADTATYGVDVRLGTRATAIERFAVETVTADGTVERLPAQHVLASTPDPARTAAPDRTGIELVTLVVDQPELDAGPRGTGMLVHPDAEGVRAKALTHATVKWPWLAEAAAGRHVLRLSYATRPRATGRLRGPGTSLPVDPDDAVGTRATRDATALLGVPVTADRVVGAARVRWYGPDLTAGPGRGCRRIGETSSGRGLAGIVAAARTSAARILGS